MVFAFDGFIVVLFSELLCIAFTRKTKQVCILEKLKCPYVVEMYDFYADDPKHLYIVLELMRGGELFDEIQKKVGASRYFVFLQK